MKYKATLIVCAVIVILLSFSFLVSEEVTVSDLEKRNMATFKMILDPVDDIDPDTGEKSVLYNVDKSIPDRLEDALKDQIFVRQFVVLSYTDLEAKLANLYSDVSAALSAPFKPKPFLPDETDGETAAPAPDETQSDTVETVIEEPPAEPDFDTYPVYGFPRLPDFPEQSYTYKNIGYTNDYNNVNLSFQVSGYSEKYWENGKLPKEDACRMVYHPGTKLSKEPGIISQK